ncbi:MAG: hypothetical protein HY535_05935 [Chloroflexi bacterium]|nr:hypothetical protein [Chloroflexota bacterium]
MTPADVALLAVRGLHLLAAVAWVGGGIFFLLVVRPALQGMQEQAKVSQALGREFRNLVDIALWVLLLTGAILAVNRLTSGKAGAAYGTVLGIKIALALGMAYLVRFRPQRPIAPSPPAQENPSPILLRVARAAFSGLGLLLLLGILVLLLSDLLRLLYEQAIARA